MARNQKNEVAMDIRWLQKPLKEQYRNDPIASQIRIRAKGGQTDVPVACSIDIGRAIYQAEAHKGRRRRYRRLFRGLFAWRSGSLRADHLPDGGGGYGHTNRAH
jgi:hypothetical protein